LLGLRDQWIEILIRYKDQNSQACIAAFTGGKINYSRAFPGWNPTNNLRTVENVIRSGASKKTVRIDNRAANVDLRGVFKRLSAKYGTDVDLLQDQDRWADNSQKTCDLMLAMYQEIADLPDKRAANLLRFMLTGADK